MSRRTVHSGDHKSFSLALTAFLNASIFIIAGVLSSAITTAGPDVLLKPSTCGRFLGRESAQLKEDVHWYKDWVIDCLIFESIVHQNLVTSSQFYRVCGNATGPAGNCNAFGREKINVMFLDVPCPFEPSICLDHQAVSLDSGLLDSAIHLGINARPEDRVSVQRTLQCALLKTEPRRKNTSADDSFRLEYGPTSNVPGDNATFILKPFLAETNSGAVSQSGYQLE